MIFPDLFLIYSIFHISRNSYSEFGNNMEKRIYTSDPIEISLELKKITYIIIVIASAIIIGFGVWAVTPFFTSTTIDEPFPTSLVLPNLMETKIIDKYNINTIVTG
jgi:hypothetical protein